ncbi:MAG: ring-cleaving dioxygenase [candidate division Zixibacteria bacterium]|nr:ring-cleaving dioxygenase [candidate division Zixibacteria bacterium]
MTDGVLGIHHVTAIASDPQRNLDFYVNLLGMRLLKLTVNYDDPGTYHLYYGNKIGSPGSALTFFPWPKIPRGRRGSGQVTSTTFSVPPSSIQYWADRLIRNQIQFEETMTASGEQTLIFEDPDGMELQLVGVAFDSREAWGEGEVPAEHGIRGFHSVTLTLEGYERTAGLMTTQLGFRLRSQHGNLFRYESGDGGSGSFVDILCQPDLRMGGMGAGIVHHVAWRAKDDAHQLRLRESLVKAGQNVTPVIDRNYFHSVYFREPGHVLFEIATDQPGFAIDEPLDKLGGKLLLPPHLETKRSQLEAALPPLTLPSKQKQRQS